MQAGAIKPLVALLGGSVMAQHRAAAALSTLAAGKAAHQARIMKAGAVEPLVAVLRSGSTGAKQAAAALFSNPDPNLRA